LLLSNGSPYTEFENNAESLMSNESLKIGCGGFACAWGNPDFKPPPPNYYASYIGSGKETYGVFNGRVYFVVGK
jgi:hypothetical protein